MSILPRLWGSQPPRLARESEFRLPLKWVDAGSGLAAPERARRKRGTGATARVRPVRIGLDFGTAYSKVSVRIADKVFFVKWSGIRKSRLEFLLPGEISRMEDDTLWIGRARGAAQVFADLKLPLLQPGSNAAQRAAAVAFLALVLRYTRGWLYQEHPALVEGHRLAWNLNIGCPTQSWSQTEARSTYRGIALQAWYLSQQPGPVHARDLASVADFAPVMSDEGSGLDSLTVTPELIAQITGYVQSPQRRDGLHLLMDVGAGTIDLATFNILRIPGRQQDRYPIFDARVLRLGTHFLMRERLENLGVLGDWDDLQAIPTEQVLAATYRVELAKVTAAQKAFEGRLAQAVSAVLTYTRQQRYNQAPEWRSGLPTFLCGGGATCGLYTRALDTAFERCSVRCLPTPFPLLTEAAQDNRVSEAEFNRLCVAYGLTFESSGEIVPPEEIDDTTRSGAPRDRQDTGQLYT